MTATRILLLVTLALGTGCATYDRGTLAAASTKALDVPMTVIERDVEGRSCGEFQGRRYQVAIEDALAKAPDANALVNVAYSFERLCIVARGIAVRVAPRVTQDAAERAMNVIPARAPASGRIGSSAPTE